MAYVVIDHYSLNPLSKDQVALVVEFHVVELDAYGNRRPVHVWFALVEPGRDQYLGLEMPAASSVPSLRTGWIYAGLYSPGVSTRLSKWVRSAALDDVLSGEQKLIAATLPANIESRRYRRDECMSDDVKEYLHFA